MLEEMILEKEVQKPIKQKQFNDFYRLRYEIATNSLEETERKKLSINDIALGLLTELGFDRRQLGTKYLADIIEELYHERKIYDKENPHFDLSDRRNNHYVFIKDYYECGLGILLERIDLAISDSAVKNMSINSILYGVTNDIIDQYDKSEPIKRYQII